jgi:hypothetical protein
MSLIDQIVITNSDGVVWQTGHSGDSRPGPDGTQIVECQAHANNQPPAGFISGRLTYTIAAVNTGQGTRYHAADLHTDPGESDPPDMYAFRRAGG